MLDIEESLRLESRLRRNTVEVVVSTEGVDKKMRVLVQTTTFPPLLWCTNAVDEN